MRSGDFDIVNNNKLTKGWDFALELMSFWAAPSFDSSSDGANKHELGA